jgi:hypothetical protein
VPVIGNQVVLGHINACTTGPSGGTDAYACTLGYALTAYQPQACYRFVADVANTGAATLNLHSLGAKPIVKVTGAVATPLADGDILAGQLVHVCYDGTNMQCQNCGGLAPATSASQLLGRGSAEGGGSWQPIALSAGLAMSGNVLVADAPGAPLYGTLALWPGRIVLPSTNPATVVPVTSSGAAVTDGIVLLFEDLRFDPSTAQHVFFCFAVPGDYGSGGTLYINWRRVAGTAANQSVVWKANVAAVTPGAGENMATKVMSPIMRSLPIAAGAVANALVQSTIPLNMNALAPQDSACLMLGRDPAHADDTMSGDAAAVTTVWLEYSK